MKMCDAQLEIALEDWRESDYGAKCPPEIIDAEIKRQNDEIFRTKYSKEKPKQNE